MKKTRTIGIAVLIVANGMARLLAVIIFDAADKQLTIPDPQ
jgi:hypothetical protein